ALQVCSALLVLTPADLEIAVRVEDRREIAAVRRRFALQDVERPPEGALGFVQSALLFEGEAERGKRSRQEHVVGADRPLPNGERLLRLGGFRPHHRERREDERLDALARRLRWAAGRWPCIRLLEVRTRRTRRRLPRLRTLARRRLHDGERSFQRRARRLRLS